MFDTQYIKFQQRRQISDWTWYLGPFHIIPSCNYVFPLLRLKRAGKQLYPSRSKDILILVADQNQNFCYFLSRNGILHISQGSLTSHLLHEACPDYSNHKTSLPFRSSAILYLKRCILSFLWLFTSPGILPASISLVPLRDLTWNRPCINEWMKPEPGEGGVHGQKSGGGRVWFWIWDRLKIHSESKEDRDEEGADEPCQAHGEGRNKQWEIWLPR